MSTIIGVAAAGKEISTRPFQLVTGRKWQGSAFGGVRGRTELPGLVDDYLKGKLTVRRFLLRMRDVRQRLTDNKKTTDRRLHHAQRQPEQHQRRIRLHEGWRLPPMRHRHDKVKKKK